jgi:hypothetical protein
VLQDGAYYYWVWAVSHALLALQVQQVNTPKGKVDWPAAFAVELLARQRADGSWTNRFTDSKEDDPLISTPWACAALAIGQRLDQGCGPADDRDGHEMKRK